MKRFVLPLLALLAHPALAQNATTQNGTINKNHLSIWRQDRQVGDVGGPQGQTNGPNVGRGADPFAITDNNDCGIYLNNAATTGTYKYLCFGHTADGDPVLIIDGTQYPLLGLGNGNVSGPNPTVQGNIPQWNDNFGHLLDDSGVPLASLRHSAQQNPTSGTWFVRKTGNDSNSCLITAAPCLTINAALDKALAADARQQALTIDIGAGHFAENIAVNGPAVGTVNTTGFVSATSIPMVSFVGAGSANTFVDGGNTINAASFCYAFLANNHAALAVKGMTITANAGGSSCLQSALYAQFFGTVYVVDDIRIGATNGVSVFGEEYGAIFVGPGGGPPALTFTTSAPSAVGVSATSMFQADSTIVFTGTPTYDYGFLLQTGSVVKLSANPPTSGAFNGPLFLAQGLSTFETYYLETTYPGTHAFSQDGSRWRGVHPNVSLIGSTGLGSTGSVSIVPGGDPFHGTVIMTPGGTGIASTGDVSLHFPYELQNMTCSVSWYNAGTGTFQLGSVFWFLPVADSLHLDWANGGSTVLTSGQTYYLSWLCQS